MAVIALDVVTVYHNERNFKQHEELFAAIQVHEPDGGYRLIGVDNRRFNRGFSAACNLGALHSEATAPIIGFLNPDSVVTGPFIAEVRAALLEPVVITGCRYGKPQHELNLWGVHDWVCGAVMFVQRAWFRSVGGFDEQFVWGFEESDLIRRAEQAGKRCRSISLPINHRSPDVDEPADVQYKHFHFEQAQRRYYKKWGR